VTDFSHVDSAGRPRMVDVGDKRPTDRRAVASGAVLASAEVLEAIASHSVKKGPVLDTARLAGIMAAKRTSELIPLCHPLPLDVVDLDCEVLDDRVQITATARTTGRTGVEMEALTAVSVAALTVYDMCKALDRTMVITDVRLEEKSGGRSGSYRREP
jgi:cyclic pyranopterin monophosphate synthase